MGIHWRSFSDPSVCNYCLKFLMVLPDFHCLQDMAGLISKINRSSMGPLPACYSVSM